MQLRKRYLLQTCQLSKDEKNKGKGKMLLLATIYKNMKKNVSHG